MFQIYWTPCNDLDTKAVIYPILPILTAYLFALFNGAVSGSEYIASNGTAIPEY
jgi:hypothetical protein